MIPAAPVRADGKRRLYALEPSRLPRSTRGLRGRPALRFERELAHSVERVWRAVSEPAELERWFPAAADWTPAAGETFEAGGATGEVTDVDALSSAVRAACGARPPRRRGRRRRAGA